MIAPLKDVLVGFDLIEGPVDPPIAHSTHIFIEAMTRLREVPSQILEERIDIRRAPDFRIKEEERFFLDANEAGRAQIHKALCQD
jgi:hypothetical protein